MIKGIRSIVFTDYDRGSLQLLEVNAKANCNITTCNYEVKYLEWGHHPEETSYYNLILGTDLLYSIDIVEPLFQTVAYYLRQSEKSYEGRKALFLLASSFDIGKDIENKVQESIQRFNIVSREIVPLDLTQQSPICRIQYFTLETISSL